MILFFSSRLQLVRSTRRSISFGWRAGTQSDICIAREEHPNQRGFVGCRAQRSPEQLATTRTLLLGDSTNTLHEIPERLWPKRLVHIQIFDRAPIESTRAFPSIETHHLANIIATYYRGAYIISSSVHGSLQRKLAVLLRPGFAEHCELHVSFPRRLLLCQNAGGSSSIRRLLRVQRPRHSFVSFCTNSGSGHCRSTRAFPSYYETHHFANIIASYCRGAYTISTSVHRSLQRKLAVRLCP
jgi:hypothetical protein